MEAAHTFLMPALEKPAPVCTRPANEQHLFSTFKYIPSPYMLEDQMLSRERVGSESLRLTVGGPILKQGKLVTMLLARVLVGH